MLFALPASAQLIDDSGNTLYEKIITWMYPGPGEIFSWGDNLTQETVVDEKGNECLKITHSGVEDKWFAQFAYDCLYKSGETYYLTFEVKGNNGIITSDFQNSLTYDTYGTWENFEISSEWTTITIQGTVTNTRDVVNRWVANVGDYDGTFFIRNLKLYTLVKDPVIPVIPDNEIIIAEMYPGPYQLLRWGDGLSGGIWMDENEGECLDLTNSNPNPDMPWSVQFSYDYPYEIGKTYYFKFDVKGKNSVITSQFENNDTYTNCGICNDFEISPEWRTVTVKGKPEDTGETVNRWVADIGDYDGTLYIRNMKIYTLIKETFTYEGINYAILDGEDKTCLVVGADSIDGVAVVPEVVTCQSVDYTVVEIADGAFAGKSGLLAITLPATVQAIGESVFKGCGHLASIVWSGNGKMPSGVVESIDNPNLLVYVDDKQYAPEGLDHNVVANSICESLVLTPGYPFTPVSDFTAKTSSMKKEFLQTTAVDGCAGWETLVLPFDVTRVTSPEGHALRPFAAVSDVNRQRPFWLYEADPEGEWQESAGIKAGVPYIISMPNNPRYNPAYNIHGTVTFSNPNPQKITTETTMPYVATWASGREFRSLWLPLDEKQAADAMGLNVGIDNLTDDNGTILPPGSAFHTGITPKPLEAYVVSNDNAKAFRIHGLQSAVLTLPAEDGLKIAQDGTTVMLDSSIDRIVDIYSADGTLLRKVELKAGDHVYVNGLPQGVCLIAGRKVMIKY